MIYKTYRAPTYKEAVLNARMDLGNDIYILGRKEIKEGGFLGLFAKTFTEITVAKSNGTSSDVKSNLSEKIREKIDEKLEDKSKGFNIKSTVRHSGVVQGDETVKILEEIKSIKQRLEELSAGKSNVEEEIPNLNRVINVLKENDFSDDFIREVRNRFKEELTLKDAVDLGIFEKKLKSYISERIVTSGPIEPGKGKPKVVVLIGPTGVGKTTTIAKLAATYGVLQKHDVELFTVDSYRIAAIEQLGKYAELMQIPFAVINTREEFKNAVSASKAEIIFVDTAGRSQKNSLGLAELRNVLDGVQRNIEIHLVISATAKYRDALDIISRFSQFAYSNIIITKLDETNTLGPILSVLNKDKKLSYVTTGQGVPDDIELANKQKLLDMIDFDMLYADQPC